MHHAMRVNNAETRCRKSEMHFSAQITLLNSAVGQTLPKQIFGSLTPRTGFIS